MTSADVQFEDLTEQDAIQLEEHLRRFEEAWKQGRQPTIEDHLPADGPVRRAVLVELVHTDLEYTLKAGTGAGVDAYLERFPELRQVGSIVGAFRAKERELRRRYPSASQSLSNVGTWPQVRLSCPHCCHPIDPESGASLEEASCPACGSTFRLEPAGAGAPRSRMGDPSSFGSSLNTSRMRRA
jgi:hypothetical protein